MLVYNDFLVHGEGNWKDLRRYWVSRQRAGEIENNLGGSADHFTLSKEFSLAGLANSITERDPIFRYADETWTVKAIHH